MKKILLPIVAAMLLLGGCSKELVYKPKKGGTYIPSGEITSQISGSTSGQSSEEEDVLMCTYNFYFSYSHTTKYNPETNKDEDCPILSFSAPMLQPLGYYPEQIRDEAHVLELGAQHGFSVDPTFPEFLGFSFNGVCLDEDGLWDFNRDYRQLAIVSLYGVWVTND